MKREIFVILFLPVVLGTGWVDYNQCRSLIDEMQKIEKMDG